MTLTASGFRAAAIASNTERAYRSDLAAFIRWGGSVPASSDTVAEYLASYGNTRSPYTLARHLVSIAQAHKAVGLENPCSTEVVRKTMRGIRRVRGVAQRRVDPLLPDDLRAIFKTMGSGIRSKRDCALLLIGFAGAFRRSELAALLVSDLRFVPEGMLVTLSRSKTDQEGAGRTIAIPRGRTHACPVAALRNWLDYAGIQQGKVFRRLGKSGRICDEGISGGSVALIIKEHVTRIGLDPRKYSGHSLRAGLVTSAARSGVSSWKIRAQTGHKSDTMLQRYVRESDLFNANAAGQVL